MDRKISKTILFILVLSIIVWMSGPIGTLAKEQNSNNDTKFKKATELNRDKYPKVKKIKSKLDTNLLKITGKVGFNKGESREKLIQNMVRLKQYVQKGYKVNRTNTTATNDLVFVYIKAKNKNGLNNVKALAYKVENLDENIKEMAAWIGVNKLGLLDSISDITSVSTIMPPVCNTAISEGDHFHRADLVRALGTNYNGTGIKIGVISDGADSIAYSFSEGELDSSKTHVISNEQGGDEGTAMLEIVHDLAPGAELYFHDCGSNPLAFNSAIDDLVSQGCKIVVDDIGWVVEPFFQDGTIAQHVKSVVDNGILYISSAGNAAREHYQGLYKSDGSSYHDFNTGDVSTGNNLYLKIYPGQSVRVVLEWDDPFGSSANDYDLYLVNFDTSEELANSINSQDGTQNPLECMVYYNDTQDTIEAAIEVEKYNGEAKNLEIYIYGNTYSNNIVCADSIFGHPAVPGVIAAAAIDVGDDPNSIAVYSSQGPVTMLNGQVRQMKPDISGAAGVSISGAGGFSNPFYGTSAAAPHIAAIAGLVWGGNPAKTNVEIRNMILNNAVDMGALGFDTAFGYGKADAYNAVNSGVQPVNITSFMGDKPSPQTVNTTVKFTVEATGGTERNYAFWIYDGSTWTPREYSTSNILNWTPTVPGTYEIYAWAKDKNSANTYDDVSGPLTYTITGNQVQPVKITSFVGDKPSPQPVNTAVKFTIEATGGTERNYAFLIYDGRTWTSREYSTSNIFNWIPTVPGTYEIYAWAKDKNSANTYDDVSGPLTYTITGNQVQPVKITNFVGDKPSPQTVNTTVKFTIEATGGMERNYAFLIYDGSTWTSREYSTSNIFNWTPTVPGTYEIYAWAKDKNSANTYDDVSGPLTYTITGNQVQPVKITNFVGDKPSPQTVNTTVKFTIEATGGMERNYAFLIYDGSTWTSREYSTSNIFSWTPTVPGTYEIYAWAKDKNSANTYDDVSGPLTYKITENQVQPVKIMSFVGDKPSPQPVNTTITFTVGAIGGTERNYGFWIYDGSTWTPREYSTSNILNWTPTVPGTYEIYAWAKDKNSVNTYDDVSGPLTYKITDNQVQPVKIMSFVGDKPSPQPVNTTITFTVGAIGGTERNYGFLIYDGRTWTSREYSTSNIFNWIPTVPGTYEIYAWAKDKNSANTYDDVSGPLTYTITGNQVQPVKITNFVGDKPSPQPVNTTITFTVGAIGGTERNYGFWIYDGSTWTPREYSTSNILNWTPTVPGTYEIYAWAKDKNSVNTYDDVSGPLIYTITGSQQPLSLSTLAFNNGGYIPLKYTHTYCGGQNTSIPLQWNNVPSGTKSFAVVMYDENAESFIHWIVKNISVSTTSISEGASLTSNMPSGSIELTNDYGDPGYGGPCPPSGSGTHLYRIRLYAIDLDSLSLSGTVTIQDIENAISGHMLGMSEICGYYGN